VRGAASAAQRLGDRKKTVFSVEIAHNGFVNRFVNQAELVQTLEAFPISAAKRRSGEAAKRRSGEAAKRRSGEAAFFRRRGLFRRHCHITT
jgi:hypothetical protein